MGEVEKPKALREMTQRDDGGISSLKDITAAQGIMEVMEAIGVPGVDPKRLAQFFALSEDEMAFEIRKINRQENATFSEDAVLSLRNNVMQWVMARIWNRWAATLEPPHFLRLKVEIEWDR